MNLADFHFIRPYWLLALIPAIVVLVLLWRRKLSRGNWSAVCDAELMPFILQQKPAEHNRAPLALGALTLLLSIIALAGPTWERLPAPAFRNDAALVIVLDLSSSMDAADVKPSRLERARFKISDILQQRKDGQTALIVFAEAAFIVTPLTTDTETISSQIKALDTSIMPTQGKNTDEALQLATQLLQQAGLQQGHILLMTDAVNSKTIKQASDIIGQHHLSVMGIGTEEGAPVKAAKGGFMKDLNGNILLPRLEKSQLKKLASAGGGRYVTFTGNDSDIQSLSRFFDDPSIQQNQQAQDLYIDHWAELGPWLMLLILPLAAIGFRKGILSVLPLLFMLPADAFALSWQDLWQTGDQQAQQAFNQQQYDAAAENFASAEWKAAALYKAGQFQQAAELLASVKTPEGHYNRGNALAKTGQLQAAVAAYQDALNLDESHEDAQFNKELIEKHLQNQQQQDPPPDNSSSENEKPQEEQQDQEKNSDQPEQNEHAQQDQQSSSESEPQEHQHDQHQADQNAEHQAEKQENEAQQMQAEEEQSEGDKAENMSAQQAAPPVEMTEEEKQATEQWLNRIQDNPSGLLKRKFKYQYGQRNR